MKKSELKKIAQTHGGFKYINNNISGDMEYIKTDTVMGFKRVFVPNTYSSLFSDWMFCIEVKYKGITLNAWFKRFRDGTYHLDHIWNGGLGKKVRRDARWNITKQMKEKAGI